jgi:hypothetical protein
MTGVTTRESWDATKKNASTPGMLFDETKVIPEAIDGIKLCVVYEQQRIV